MLRRRKRVPVAALVVPDWDELVDRESGMVRLSDAPTPDLRGIDVLGQSADEEANVGVLAEVTSSFFGGAPRPPLPSGAPRATPVVQPPLPAPVVRGGLRLVSSPQVEVEPEVEVDEVAAPRVSLFGSFEPDDDEEDEDDDG